MVSNPNFLGGLIDVLVRLIKRYDSLRSSPL